MSDAQTNCSPLDLSGVSLLRGGKLILDDVSWHIGAGENWAVVGANGSGKTTLLKVATGYLWASSGTVRVLGQTFGRVDLRALRRRIGWVSSALTDRIPPSQTSIRIVLSGAFASIGLWDDPAAAQRLKAGSLLEQMGCPEIADRKFAVLSAGERQKVLVARALMAEPEVLILDEACAGLDIAAREGLLAKISSLDALGSGMTLIFVTHHIEEIPSSISHVLVLKAGRALAAGPTDEVLNSRVLSDAFDMPVCVDAHGGRFSTRVDARVT